MSWAAVWAVAAAVGVDGWLGGVATGLRRIRLGPVALGAVALTAGVWAGLAMAVGLSLARFVPAATARWTSAALLFGAGVTMLHDALLARRQPAFPRVAEAEEGPESVDGPEPGEGPPEILRPGEALLLGCVVASGAAAAAFAVGLAGRSSLAVPVAIALAELLPGELGNPASVRRFTGRLARPFALLPGGVLVVLGVLGFW